MANFWQGIEKVRGWATVAAVWRQHMGDEDFERVRNTFVLPNGRQAIWFPSPDVCECKMDVVIHAPDHIVGVTECGGCDDIALTAADIAMYELSWKKLGRSIAIALRCEPKDVDIGVPGARQIAAFGGGSMPVILVIQLDRHEFADVLRRIVLEVRKNFVLLSPTGRFMDANGKGLLARVNAGFFTLESIINVMPNGTLHAARSAGELFSAYLPEQREPVQKNEAARVFEIVRKLRSEAGKGVAPLFDVFNYLVLDGLSQRQAAKQCGCSVGSMSLRVAALEERFNLTIEQLRGFASDVKEMESTVKADRYRRKSDGGRFESDAEAETEAEEEEF